MNQLATHKKRRILNYLQAEDYLDCVFGICVRYGKGYKNEGQYGKKVELIHALNAFTEKDLIKEYC